MSREFDKAAQDVELQTQDAIAGIRRRAAHRELAPTGACHYCGEGVKPQALFCPDGCSQEWEFEQEQKRRNGTLR